MRGSDGETLAVGTQVRILVRDPLACRVLCA